VFIVGKTVRPACSAARRGRMAEVIATRGERTRQTVLVPDIFDKRSARLHDAVADA
jgi:hypothetical protein